jgi:hypothetical protein
MPTDWSPPEVTHGTDGPWSEVCDHRSMRPLRSPRTPALVLLVLLVAGCTDGGSGEDQVVGDGRASATSTTTPDDDGEVVTDDTATTTTTTTTASSPSAFEGTEGPTEVPSSDPSADRVLLDDVRVGREGDVERVVFEFRGDVAPGYEVRYIDRPVRESGSGDEIEVAGGGLLEIAFTPSSTVAFTPDGSFEETYTGPDRLGGEGGVTEVVRTGDFEARLEWVIGLDRRVPYRVLVLPAPLRVVIETPAR